MSFRLNKRFVRRSFIVLMALVCISTVAWFTLRNYIVHKVIHAVETKVKEKYAADLAIRETSFSGFATLTLTGITLIPQSQDTLLTADTLTVEPALAALLTGHLKLNSVFASTINVNLVKSDSVSNYGVFIHSRHADESTKTTGPKSYAALADRLLRNVFYYMPADMSIQHVELTTLVNGEKESASLSISKRSDILEGSMEDITRERTWKMSGDLNSGQRVLSATIYALKDTAPVTLSKIVKQRLDACLPFTEAFLNATFNFDTLSVSLNENKLSNHELVLTGQLNTAGLHIHHDKISQEEVIFDRLAYQYHFTISDHALVADSTNSLQINDINAHAGFSFANGEAKEFGIDFITDATPASDFFASLPQGMFNNFDRMKADGKLQYTFHFRFNSDTPDSLVFESTMKKDKFRITQYGVTNFSMINGDFTYTAYEHDKPFRTIEISTSNPNFIPLQYIPACFKNAVLTSEDGSFFFHNGFNEGAFKKSIAENYKAGKFVRGGSTITMQLVKNVFLSRHKTVARKAEEALIVWLIENNHLVSKERMLEVYLNIIELGPNIYGVNEAAKFYFNKNATELTLAESIFLASLLPRPKWFKYSFDKNGMLKPYFADYFRVVSNFLLKKELISQEEYDQLRPEITLKGPARNVVMPVDSVPPDIEEDN